MRWGHIEEAKKEEQLLYWVLLFVLEPYFEEPIDHWLKKILAPNGGLGGDPGWEMEYLTFSDNDRVCYRVWAAPEVSGIEPNTKIYSEEEVKNALHESLLALKKEYPNKAHEIGNVITQYIFPRVTVG
jgi:hypothetical protein